MFDDTLRDNLRNMTIGLALTVVIVGAALWAAFL
jgi:hypothetical protein